MTNTKILATKLAVIVLAATGLAACGPQSPEDVRAAAIAKCERQFGRMSPDPAKGNALCSCMADDMAAEGVEITDMLGEGREAVKRIVRSCARRAGVPLPTG
ncbi:MAG: hypothetical protein ABJ239_10255 [Erythrobacter sp.]